LLFCLADDFLFSADFFLDPFFDGNIIILIIRCITAAQLSAHIALLGVFLLLLRSVCLPLGLELCSLLVAALKLRLADFLVLGLELAPILVLERLLNLLKGKTEKTKKVEKNG
jgi:hypothetical protein